MNPRPVRPQPAPPWLPISLLTASLLLGSFALAPIAASSSTVRFVPPPPPLQGRPIGSRRGGASRGSCPTGAQPLTALVPATIDPTAPGETPLEAVWGLTTAERPTFWFYLPYALTADRPGEFVLLDDENNYVYQAAIVGSGGEGVIGVPLPATAAPLAVDRLYSWTFLVYCEADNPTFTQGQIQRVALPASLASGMPETATAQAALYARHGLWHDALTALAAADRSDPAIAADWRSLLESVGLGEIADRPLLDCCAPQ